MQDATIPKNDRELLISLDQKVENFIEKSDDRQERTVAALEALVLRFEKFEETKFSTLDNRVTKLEAWKQRWGGGIAVVGTILVLVTLALTIKDLMK